MAEDPGAAPAPVPVPPAAPPVGLAAVAGKPWVARVLSDGLAREGLHAGDEVLLTPRTHAEHGDLVAVRTAGADGPLSLWKAQDGGPGLMLVNDGARIPFVPAVALHGVVIAVRRRRGSA